MTAAISGCSGDDERIDTVVRDSAQVRIVETWLPPGDSLDGWEVGSPPTLQIGLQDGSEEYLFGNVVGAWRGGDGRVTVADRTTSTVRVFDGSGAFLSMFGQFGEGPAEFAQLTSATSYRGDSVLVWDAVERQFTVFSADGDFSRTFRIDYPEVREQGMGSSSFRMDAEFHGTFNDGSVLFSSPVFLWMNRGERVEFTVEMLRYGDTGEFLNDAGRHIRGEWSLSSTGVPLLPVPFPRRFEVAVSGSRFAVAASREHDVQIWNKAGFHEQSWRIHGFTTNVTRAMRDSVIERQMDIWTSQMGERTAQVMINDIVFPDNFTSYANILFDDEGGLWIRDSEELSEGSRFSSWRILTSTGEYLGAVQAPSDLTLSQAGRDTMMGVYTDDLGVPTLRVYAFQRD